MFHTLPEAVEKIDKYFLRYRGYHSKIGTLIIKSEEEPAGAYYLKYGRIRQFIISESGKEVTIHNYFPGSVIPLTWILNSEPNLFFYEVSAPSIIYISSVGEFIKLIHNNPDISFYLNKKVLSGINKLADRVVLLTTGTARQKVISTLLYYFHHFGNKKGAQTYIDTYLTHDEIALFSAITRETVSKIMSQLKTEKLINIKNSKIFINSLNNLEKEIQL